jgi:hypothetical protein
MSDSKIVVEFRSTPRGARFQNEYEHMFEMMDAVYKIMNQNPNAVIKIWKVWDFGKGKVST